MIVTGMLLAIALLFLLFAVGAAMQERGWEFVICALGAAAFVVLACHFCFVDGYRQGQIDALNGEVQYQKVEQPNGEVLWERFGGSTQ